MARLLATTSIGSNLETEALAIVRSGSGRTIGGPERTDVNEDLISPLRRIDETKAARIVPPDQPPLEAHDQAPPASSARICASSITVTPSSRALSSLLPASLPATT